MSQSRTAIMSDSVVQGQKVIQHHSPQKKEADPSIAKQGTFRKGLVYFFMVAGLVAILSVYAAVFIYRSNSSIVQSEKKPDESSGQRRLQQKANFSQPHPSVIPIFKGKVETNKNHFVDKNLFSKRQTQVVALNQRSHSNLRQKLAQATVTKSNYPPVNPAFKRYNKGLTRVNIPTVQSSYGKHSALSYKSNSDLMRGNERFNKFKRNYIATRRAADARNPLLHRSKMGQNRRQASHRRVTFNHSRFVM